MWQASCRIEERAETSANSPKHSAVCSRVFEVLRESIQADGLGDALQHGEWGLLGVKCFVLPRSELYVTRTVYALESRRLDTTVHYMERGMQ